MHSSWWDQSWLEADVVVIGGGIIGVSTAIEVLDRRPGTRVMLLERDVVPAGASTRNAGFACVGSVSEIAHDIHLLGATAAADIIEQRRRGLAILRQRIGDTAMGLLEHGAHELFATHHPALDAVDDVNDLLRPLFNTTVFTRCDDDIVGFGFANTHALVSTPVEGTIDSGKMMAALWGMAAARGVQLRTGCRVEAIEEGRVLVATPEGRRSVKAGQIVIATNAWPVTVDGIVRDEYLPARGQVVVTSPIEGLTLRGSFHMDEGYVYFRALGDRVLLGGARNLDVAGEQTFEMECSAIIQNRLLQLLDTVILPGKTFSIDHRWAGMMGFSSDKRPHVSRYSSYVVRAFGCNGMGVAIGSTIAQQAAELVA